MRINLASPEIKKNLRYEMLGQHILFAGFLALTLLAWFTLLLGGMLVFAEMKDGQITRRIRDLAARAETRDIERFNQELRTARRSIERLNVIQGNHPRFTSLLRKLITALPDGVLLKEVSVDAEKQKMTIAGIAPTRNALLAFRAKLEADRDYANIILPLDQLLKEVNPPFSISLDLASSALRP